MLEVEKTGGRLGDKTCTNRETPHLPYPRAWRRVYMVGYTQSPRSIANQLFLSSFVWQFLGFSSRERTSSSEP